MTPKQTVSLHACLISCILVHDCVFVAYLLLAAVQDILATRAPLSCSPCVISPLGGPLHHHGNNVNPSGIELQPTVISLGIVLGPPPSVPPSMNSMTGRAPPDSRPGLPDNFVQSKRHLDSREIYGKTLLRKIAATSWSSKYGLAGQSMEQVKLVDLLWRGWHNQLLRALSHGSYVSLLYPEKSMKQSSCKLCCL